MFTPNANKVQAVITLLKESTISKRLLMTMESSFKNISQTMEAPSPAKNSELIWRSKDRTPYIWELEVAIKTEVLREPSGPS